MKRYLLMYSVGPVADFVSFSRRTRDLYFASYFVSEMARTSALELSKMDNVKLIVPADAEKNAPVTDRILLEVKTDNPDKIADIAKTTAYSCWKDKIKKVFNKYSTDIGINETIWQLQAESDLIEFFAAWTEWKEDVDYPKARVNVEALLNARETLTDFQPNAGDFKVDKSSLDGRRETVLQNLETQFKNNRIHKGIRVAENSSEQLDLPGLVKRLADFPEADDFVSVSRIAVDPWVRGANKDMERANVIAHITEICERHSGGFTKGQYDVCFAPTKLDRYSAFPCKDGQLLMKTRLKSMKLDYPKTHRNQKAFDAISTALSSKDIGEPHPYLAVIACDGDNMTKYVDELLQKAKENKEDPRVAHQQFSENLSEFAKSVPGIVSNRMGMTVYAGGDDVLAIVPLDHALECAKELRCRFAKIVKDQSLSVGIAIVHAMTPMRGDMVRYADDALYDAKRKGLAIHLHKRSGAPTRYKRLWKNEPEENFKRWLQYLQLDLLPHGAAYEIRAMADTFTSRNGKKLEWVDVDLVRRELKRLLGKKKPKDKEKLSEEIRDAILKSVNSLDDLKMIANEIIIAQEILKSKEDAGEEIL